MSPRRGRAALCGYRRIGPSVALLVVIEHLVRGNAVYAGAGIIPPTPAGGCRLASVRVSHSRPSAQASHESRTR
jgi:hypothetical protein